MSTSEDSKTTMDLDLGRGRKAKVHSYPNGEVTFEVSGGPYVISQFFMPGPAQPTIIKLSPGKQGSSVPKTSF